MKLERKDDITYLNREDEKEGDEMSNIEEAEALKNRLLSMIKKMTDTISESAKNATETQVKEEGKEDRDESTYVAWTNAQAKIKERERREEPSPGAAKTYEEFLKDVGPNVLTPEEQAEKWNAAAEAGEVAAPNAKVRELRAIANMDIRNLSGRDCDKVKKNLLDIADNLDQQIKFLRAKLLAELNQKTKLIIASKELNGIKYELGKVIDNME